MKKSITQLNTTAARAERKIFAAYATIEKSYERLDDISRDLFKRASRQSDREALAALGAVVRMLDDLVHRGVTGTATAHYNSDHLRKAFGLLQERLRDARPTGAGSREVRR